MKQHILNKQAGASMVEIVVTIIIIAIGLLGVASLQANTMRYLKVANQRTEATQAAYDLSERMRANGQGVKDPISGAASYTYTTAYATTVASLPPVPTCGGPRCTPAEVAGIDINDWLRGLSNRLTDGAGYIVPVAPTGYDVIVMWKEANLTIVDPACPTATAPAPGVGVRCFTVRFSP
ncbi:type IV pilus modification protein PilV [Undibacterium sp. TC4M20W]|uniref:type IV pilus modification protein PilV n=1 Tax=Undibacterium sp. TC4M20W TaxID=3413052 RepID=UPI003BF31FBA